MWGDETPDALDLYIDDDLELYDVGTPASPTELETSGEMEKSPISTEKSPISPKKSPISPAKETPKTVEKPRLDRGRKMTRSKTPERKTRPRRRSTPRRERNRKTRRGGRGSRRSRTRSPRKRRRSPELRPQNNEKKRRRSPTPEARSMTPKSDQSERSSLDERINDIIGHTPKGQTPKKMRFAKSDQKFFYEILYKFYTISGMHDESGRPNAVIQAASDEDWKRDKNCIRYSTQAKPNKTMRLKLKTYLKHLKREIENS